MDFRLTNLVLSLLCLAGLHASAALEVRSGAPSAPIAATAQDDVIALGFGSDGMAFDEFCARYGEATGKTVFYDARKIQNKRIFCAGEATFPRARAEAAFGAILRAQGMVVLDLEPADLNLVAIEDVNTSQDLKQRASFVDAKDLDQLAATPGKMVCTVVTLEHLPVEKAHRALSQMIQEHRSGFVQPVEEANSLVITNFASVVTTMVRVARSLDQAAGTDAAKAWQARLVQSPAAEAKR